MKKLVLFAAIAAGLSFGLVSCGGAGEQKQNATEQTAKADYTCTMHPEYHSDKPGKCPTCGMDLVKNEKTAKTDSVPKKDTTKH